MSKFFDDSDIVKEGSSSFFDESDIVKEELQPTEDIGALRAGIQGALRDTTFGFSDELAGGLAAGARALGVTGLGKNEFSELGLAVPTLSKEELLKAYREGRDRIRGLQAAAEEQAPVTTAVSGIAGSLLTNPLGGLAKAAAPLGKLGQSIAVGGTAGAIAATGQAEELSDVGEEALSGAGLGAAIGGALPIAGAAARGIGSLGKGILDIGTSVPTVSSTIRGFRQGLRGQSVSGEEAFERIGKEAIDLADEVGAKLSATGSDLAKKQTQILESAADQPINIRDIIGSLGQAADEGISAIGSKAKSDIKTLNQAQKDIIQEFGLLPAEKKLLDEMPQFADDILAEGSKRLETASPVITNKIKKSLSGLSGVSSQADIPELQTVAGQKIAGTKAKEITDRLYKQLPELETTNKLIADFNNSMAKVGSEAVNNKLLDAKDALKLRKGFFNLIRTAEGKSDQSIVSREAVRELEEVLGKVNPELRDDIIPKIKDVADRLDLSRQSIGSGNLIGAVMSLGGRTVVGGEVAGKAVKTGMDAISDMTPQMLKDLSRLVAAKGGPVAQRLSTKLNEASGTDGQSKRALLFSLMQQPEYRKMLEEGED